MLKIKLVLGIIVILALLIGSSSPFLVSTSPAVAQDEPCQECQQSQGEGEFQYPAMRPSRETLQRWIEAYNSAPIAPVYELKGLQVPAPTQPFSLLDHLQYTPSERNQGSCGNCWAWAGTGVMEIALDVQNSIKDRLSIQYLNSNYNGGSGSDWACCGGWLEDLADFYTVEGQAIPWSNTNAEWQDGGQGCGGSTTVPAGTISPTPNYPVTSITEQTITTQGVGETAAIDNIKNILDQDKAVWFAFFVATSADWNTFGTFWLTQGEDVIWDPDYSCGHTVVDDPYGHAVLCVGYNDEAGTDNDYWLMLNSWGTTGSRPNGLFRMDMHMDYDCYFYDPPYAYWSFYFQTLDVDYSIAPIVTSVDPSSAEQGQTLDVTIAGASFTGATTVSFGADIAVNSFTVDSDAQITANITIAGGATPGMRNVSVTTPEGTGTLTDGFEVVASSAPPTLETGQASVNHNWQTVYLTVSFTDPVVVAKPLSYNGNDPSVVRIRNVTPTSFEICLQEWDYLDGLHAIEQVSWLAMERGHWTLSGGAEVEAGTIDTSYCGTGTFASVNFSSTFTSVPVIISSVMTVNETDAVVTRNKNVTTAGFEVIMQEQELNAQSHATETISYIAWEPSSGTEGSIDYEVALGGNVQHTWATIGYGPFASPPYFLADMQTTNGGDTCNLRYKDKTTSSVKVQVDEEESADSEIGHYNESVGYFAFTTS